ncbi:MAG TPA: multicopper oxidase domain-containing protein [Acidimicrobiales bacterium]
MTVTEHPSATPAEQPPPSPPDPSPPSPSPPFPVGAAAIVAAVLALVFAVAALVFNRDGAGDDAAAGGTTSVVELSEFAISPASVTVAEGGSVTVNNTGSTPHDLTVQGTDITTGEIAAGGSATLDLSSLAPGTYDLLCTVPGHSDAGMTGTLTIGGAGTSGLAAGGGDEGDGGGGGGEHANHGGMTEADYQRLDEAMEASINEFPAETEGRGNQVLEPEVLPDGTKRFQLTAAVTEWEVAPGEVVDAWTYNGMVPGPQIQLEVGDKVEIVLHNELPMGTDLHLHGINVPNSMDGVAPITQELIEPGESFTYEFTTDEPAVAMYHAHHHGQMQVPNGLLGTVMVGDVRLPTGTVSDEVIPADLQISQEIPMVLNDAGVIGYSLNGKSFPATEPVTAKTGDWVLIHYFNEGTQIHPMHLHQFDQIVVAKDGYPIDHPYVADTVNVAPGERYSVLVQLDEPGTWVWHCHILPHVERETGMFGMVTAVIVE